MKTVKLQSLTLTHFKGIKEFGVTFDGKDAVVFGENATGKTSLFDGFLWVLFDKDSANDSKFALKTLDATGKEMHNLEHTVEAAFTVDGQATTFKKVYKEVYKRTKGSANKTFTGHTTDYCVDGVPMSKAEYTKKVATIVQEDVFKLLTSPSYFNENLKWQERRAILIELAGDVTDDEIISTDAKLKGLNELLSGKSIDDLKKIIASRKKHINDALGSIPVRIDEITKGMPTTTANIEELKADVATVETKLDELKTQKFNVQNGGVVAAKKNEILDLEFSTRQFKNDFQSNALQEVSKLRTKVEECSGNLQIVNSKLRDTERARANTLEDIDTLGRENERLENQIRTIKAEHAVLAAQQFEFEDKCECPTCKQSLPEGQVQAVRDEAEAQFKEQISIRQTEIKNEGPVHRAKINANDEKINALLEEHESLELKIIDIRADIAQKEKELAKANERLNDATNAVPDATKADEYLQMQSAIAALKEEIQNAESLSVEAIKVIDAEIAQLNTTKQAINAELAQFASVDASKKRISELEAEQKQLADEFESLEANLYLIEEFTRKKVEILTERINGMFQHATFKLFDEQVNGGLNETCETLYKNVPYGSGLNNAGKINVGLDIINTLSTHYGIQAPIFVDNAEAVTKFIDVQAQLIQLVVSKEDKVLRVVLGEAN